MPKISACTCYFIDGERRKIHKSQFPGKKCCPKDTPFYETDISFHKYLIAARTLVLSGFEKSLFALKYDVVFKENMI